MMTMKDLQGVTEYNMVINGEHTRIDLTKLNRKQKREMLRAINKTIKNKELDNLTSIKVQRHYIGDKLIKQEPVSIAKLI